MSVALESLAVSDEHDDVDDLPPETCDECGGSGRVRWAHRDCPACSGDGVMP